MERKLTKYGIAILMVAQKASPWGRARLLDELDHGILAERGWVVVE